MDTEIGRHLREVRVKTRDSLRAMAIKMGISAAYLSAIENGKRNVPAGFLETFFNAYSLTTEEQANITQSVYQSISKYTIDLTNLSDIKRQVLLSVIKDEIDESTMDKLVEIYTDSSAKKTEKL